MVALSQKAAEMFKKAKDLPCQRFNCMWAVPSHEISHQVHYQVYSARQRLRLCIRHMESQGNRSQSFSLSKCIPQLLLPLGMHFCMAVVISFQ